MMMTTTMIEHGIIIKTDDGTNNDELTTSESKSVPTQHLSDSIFRKIPCLANDKTILQTSGLNNVSTTPAKFDYIQYDK